MCLQDKMTFTAVDDGLWESGVSKDLYNAFSVLSKVPVSHPNICVSVVNLNCYV